jgi:dATP pyrophosphohydrolase
MQIVSDLIEAHIFHKSVDGIEFLLLKRAERSIYPGLWQMVTGKMKKNEPAYKAALREIKEETGMVPVKFWVAPNINSFYDQSRDVISNLPVFVCRVAEDSDVLLSEEHCKFQWAKPEIAKHLLAWPGQKKSVDIITEYFSDEKSLLKFIEIML